MISMIEALKTAVEGAAWIWAALSVLGMTVVPISLWLGEVRDRGRKRGR